MIKFAATLGFVAAAVSATPADARFSEVFGPLKNFIVAEQTASLADPVCGNATGAVPHITFIDVVLFTAAVDGIDI